MHSEAVVHRSRRKILAAALVALALAVPSSARALNIGYYEMCQGQGSSSQLAPINAAGHTPVNLFDLSPASLAAVDVIFVDNCDNLSYGSEYLLALADIEAAVASGKVLMLHDRYVDPAESILPGGLSFDIQRAVDAPGTKEIDVYDDSTLLTNGAAGTITDTNLDNGCESSHGFSVAGTLPGDARFILTRSDPSQIVTFAYGYGAGVVIYSSLPLDFYLDGSSCSIGAVVRNIYAVNAIQYAVSLTEGVCGNGVLDGSETCDLGGNNNGETCCRFDCTLRPAGLACRDAQDECDIAEVCDGVSDLCPADVIEPAGTVCRSATGDCDAVEACDGSSIACPTDELIPAGTACRAAADSCDAVESCDGASIDCPSDAALPDGDGDTVCDAVDNCDLAANPLQEDDDNDGTGNACDACTNIASTPVKTTKITLSKLLAPAGDDAMTINTTFLFVPTSPTLDPVANGVRVILEGVGTTIFDATIPGGAYSKTAKVGWSVNRAHTSFRYKNASPAPIAGINVITVKRTSKGQTKVGVRGKKSTYSVAVGQLPLKATIVLDPPTAETGQCGETGFVSGACKFNRTGSGLTCK